MSFRCAFFALAVAACSSSPSSSSTAVESAPDEPSQAARGRLDPPSTIGSLGGFIARDGDALMATWLEPIAAGDASAASTRRGPHRVQFARLSKGAWSEATTIAQGADVFANWADTPSVARGGDGALVAHWAQRVEGGPYAYNVALARSTDDGATWQHIGLAHDDGTATEHGFVSLIPSPSGVRAFWLDGRLMAGGGHGGHGSGSMTLRTALVGEAITGAEVVDPRVCDCCGTSAVTTGAGSAIVYRDRSADEVRDMSIARRTGTGWSEPRPVHDDNWTVPGCPVNGPAAAADGKVIAVAWYTYAGERGSVRVALSADDGVAFAAPIEVDGPVGRRSPLGRVDLELLSSTEAIVTWMSSDREDAAVFARRVTADGRVGQPLQLLSTRAARDAGFPRIARHGDAIGLLYTETGDRTHVRFELIPLDAIAPATAQPPAQQPATDGLLAVGAPFPGIAVDKLDGSRGTVAELRGAVTLVNIWATWCEPCRHELPVLAAVSEAHAAAGLRVVAISVDRNRTADELRAFATKRELPFPVWHDADDRASAAFGVGPLPASFLFDRNGTLVWRRAGAIQLGDESLEQAVKTALAAMP